MNIVVLILLAIFTIKISWAETADELLSNLRNRSRTSSQTILIIESLKSKIHLPSVQQNLINRLRVRNISYQERMQIYRTLSHGGNYAQVANALVNELQRFRNNNSEKQIIIQSLYKAIQFHPFAADKVVDLLNFDRDHFIKRSAAAVLANKPINAEHAKKSLIQCYEEFRFSPTLRSQCLKSLIFLNPVDYLVKQLNGVQRPSVQDQYIMVTILSQYTNIPEVESLLIKLNRRRNNSTAITQRVQLSLGGTLLPSDLESFNIIQRPKGFLDNPF